MADIEHMARLWAAGCSMGQIASAVGLSRGSVAGYIGRNRSKFARKNSVASPEPKKPAETILTASQKANERRKAFHAVKVAEVAPVALVEPEINGKEYDASRLPMAKDLMALESGECKWPLTDIGPHLFCCAEAVTGSPYCAHHKQRSKGKGTISEQKAISDGKRAA